MGKQTTPPPKSVFTVMYTKSGFGRGCQETGSMWQRVCIYHVCMCTYTAYVAQLSSEVCRPRSPKCNLPLGWSAVPWRQTEGGTLGKAPRLLRKSARVHYRFGGFPPHTSSEENISSPPFKKLLIHSISVKWFADLGVCPLIFPSDESKNIAIVARAGLCMD